MYSTDLMALADASPASQDGWEMWQMLEHVAMLEPKVIVEIGCDGGGFLYTLKKAFPKADIVGIEIKERKELYPYHVIYGDSQSPDTVSRLVSHIRPSSIDFLFIDGDHHYEAVKTEYQLYAPLVRRGGIIGFHDTNSRGIEGVEVDRFMRELDHLQSYQTMDFRTDRFSPGTRIVWV